MKRLLLCCLIMLITKLTFGQINKYIQYFVQVPYSYDFKNKVNNFGIDADCNLLLLNGGIEYKYCNYNKQNNGIYQPIYDESLYIDKKNSISGYLGLGYFSIIQLQAGFSSNNYMLFRLRSEWRLVDLAGGNYYRSKFNKTFPSASLKVNIDKAIKTNKAGWFVSVGVGYSWGGFSKTTRM